MSKVKWEDDMKTEMWTFLMMQKKKDDTSADEECLKENVARLIKMTAQMTAGQRKGKKDIDWVGLNPTIMRIVCSAASMCLNGRFGDMPKEIDEAD